MPELRRRVEDHRGHPGSTGNREDPQPPRAGCAAATEGLGARGGASSSCLSCPGRKHINSGRATPLHPAPPSQRQRWHCATWRLDAAILSVNPGAGAGAGAKAKTTACERARAGRSRPGQRKGAGTKPLAFHAAAAQSSGIT